LKSFQNQQKGAVSLNRRRNAWILCAKGNSLTFCITKTTSSAGGSKKLSLCPDYLSERSEESGSLLLREKGDHEVVDEEFLGGIDTSSVSRQAAATFPRWGRQM